ncbi:galactokinase [Algoriphagus confluentis]|uniref:Galactokinase n=1 Tax=Algoriphagus confluentis TaxID=1697556 RepID=A0ABQ6PQG7_9BACT|nr:galactokinase [Algoriphagus confluentis]
MPRLGTINPMPVPMQAQLTKTFLSHFAANPLITFAPGRINLIGEHTDYQEGFVFPAAVKQGIWVAIQKNESPICRLVSADFGQEFSFDLNSLAPKKGHWANYIMGMCALMRQSGYEVKGFDMVLAGNIPVGSGLSSSAALSVSVGTAISAIFDFGIPKKNLALYAQKSEHLYAGVNCGIMDPYASAFGVEGKALLLDCRSKTHREIPVGLGDYSLILVNSKVKHSLADSAYNERREACEESVRLLKTDFPEINTLRDLSLSELEMVRAILPDALFPKAKHVITECQRVLQSAKALQKGNLAYFGSLLNASHSSLSQDFEVSCPELDFLSHTAQAKPEVLGVRMMGGGFGGCTLNLVETKSIEKFIAQIQIAYEKQFFKSPEFIPVEISEGARVI